LIGEVFPGGEDVLAADGGAFASGKGWQEAEGEVFARTFSKASKRPEVHDVGDVCPAVAGETKAEDVIVWVDVHALRDAARMEMPLGVRKSESWFEITLRIG
jgi:hypothetical protein